jgi:hypothetical protein
VLVAEIALGDPSPTVTAIGNHEVLIESTPVVALATYSDSGALNFLGVGVESGTGTTPVLVTSEPLLQLLETDAQLAFHHWLVG